MKKTQVKDMSLCSNRFDVLATLIEDCESSDDLADVKETMSTPSYTPPEKMFI